MDLKRAIEIVTEDATNPYIEAIEIVIAELHATQNLLDEKNEELDRLQKENEKLKIFKNEVEKIKKEYPSLDIDDCVNVAIELDALLK